MDSLFSNRNTVAPDDADLEFLAVRDHERWRDLRACLDKQWARYHEHADTYFLDQIQRRGQFHARIWEL